MSSAKDRPEGNPSESESQDLQAESAEEAAEIAAEAAADRELEFNNLPNQLTLMRIALVPVVVGALFLETRVGDLVATGLFIAASITDYFDGYFARRRKIVTIYGKLLDPLADKFLVVSTLIMLQHLERIHPILVMLLICRELAITGLRALASAEGVIIQASDSAKWKTATQMVAIPLLMVKTGFWGIPIFPIGVALIYISLGISLWSAKDYIVGFFRALKLERAKRAEIRKQKRLEKRRAKLARRQASNPGDGSASAGNGGSPSGATGGTPSGRSQSAPAESFGALFQPESNPSSPPDQRI